ncbi:helix-turn-helix transcriptional regulator [Frankia sp. AgPm24]|uniref:Helix-turn-helix transcriptional regulator n=1 Tax=Frankia umida TaxID=573489 RepID=A0ABT0JZ68_9ACTN|nr:helix-turn-helix transcriptional regulator [Frankia sp. AgPm24]MCK9876847.1 helix-turn-helix transcriptional regulator [Frankia umida]MCK9923569.1 helix-turn-helix transcriptional regulator [Frankia sp. AgPm24]
MVSTWDEFRARRPPREGEVARHRAQLDAEVRAYRLREIREEQDLTQVELAERMHVKQPSVSDLERGALVRHHSSSRTDVPSTGVGPTGGVYDRTTAGRDRLLLLTVKHG